MLYCGGLIAAITYEEDIPAFREGEDAYRVQYGASGEWKDGKFVVSVPERRNFIMNYNRYPGMKPFRGADEIVLESDSDGLGKTTAELVLFEFPSGEKEKRKFYAPLTSEMRFKTKLDPTKMYQLGIIGIHRAQEDIKPWKIGFKSLRGVFTTSKADALRVVAKTGNSLHIVREGQGEKPVLTIHNAAQERISAHGVLEMKGFWGDTFELPIDVSLDGGQIAEVPIREPAKKGVWRIGGKLTADDGSVAKVDTCFAVMDYHGRTPKQPMGTFRLGVLWHLQRFTTEDRRLTAAAMVACGAKLTRADVANMSSIQRDGPDDWNFARTDALMETLETNGISLDAIIFHIPKWAAKPENQTNANWRVWALGRPMPGTFERFCEGLAHRYGKRIDYYEIGNEWDLKGFFHGDCEDAVDILREGYIGLKRGCPDCCVMPCGWASAVDPLHVNSKRNPGIQEAILRQCRDCFDVHPIHCHGSFAPYVNSIKKYLFPLHKHTNISNKP